MGAGSNVCSEDVWRDLGKPTLPPATGWYEVENGEPIPTLAALQGKDGKSVQFTVTKVPWLNLLGHDAIVRLQANISALMGLNRSGQLPSYCESTAGTLSSSHATS